MITKAFPDHAILSEEGNDRKQKNPCLWVIDPLDGTVNYSHGFPIYCVSVALVYNGEPLVGVVFDPERNELFQAVRGKGAFLNGKRIKVTSEKNIERALVATGFSYGVKKAKRNNLGHFANMIKSAQGVRRPGSAAIDLCWLASGRLDSFWEFDLHPWDTAAAVLIVEEAGGKISRVDGSKYSIFNGDVAASNGHLHASLRKILTIRRTKK
jgi:myo-inositol-1(or 4)-monophosphatase